MSLHQDKFQVLNYSLNTSKLLRELQFYTEMTQYLKADGNPIDSVNVVRDLGVTVSSDCSWSPHVAKTAKEANVMASWVLSVFRDHSSTVMLTLFKSLVRNKLEYCCSVWNTSKIGDIQAFETIQREFTRKIIGCKNLDYWQRFSKLKLLSLQRRRERNTIIYVWKIYHSLAPNVIGMEFYDHPRLGIRV